MHWQKTIGAQGQDVLNDMVKDEAGNFYTVGSTQTIGSQTMDVLVTKFSAAGNEIWSETIGEAGDDRGIAIEFMNDQVYVIASSTSSTGLFSENSGREDMHLIQLNTNGNVVKSTHFGGNFSDIPTDLTKTHTGDLLMVGYSQSTEGFFDSNRGQYDMWVVRVDHAGNLIWKQNYGGSDEDFSSKIDELPNGEIVFSGHSSSFDVDMGVNYGDFDLSLFKLTANGAVLWEQNYGGLQAERAIDLLIQDETRIVLAGNTLSMSYDISKNAGFSDAWVIEVDPLNGIILWEETHGSAWGDYASALSIDDNNQLYLMGTTNASYFHNEQSAGNEDAWLAKINSPESIDHIALVGGSGFEAISNFCMNADGSILIVGSSNSQNDLFSSNHGLSDGWIAQLKLNGSNASLIEAVSAHPNPTNGIVYLNNLTDSDEIVVYNSAGQIVIDSFQATAFSQTLDLAHLQSGVYLVKIQRASGSELIRLVRN